VFDARTTMWAFRHMVVLTMKLAGPPRFLRRLRPSFDPATGSSSDLGPVVSALESRPWRVRPTC
jgi:hypothetical protein